MTARIRLRVPRNLVGPAGRPVDRPTFFEAIPGLAGTGFEGLWEGSVMEKERLGDRPDLSSGAELDVAEPPSNRDWTRDASVLVSEVYFSDLGKAKDAVQRLQRKFSGAELLSVEEVPEEDWNEAWKASFRGISLDSGWDILPPWVESSDGAHRQTIWLNPGAGFGTGTHETTQLCLAKLSQQAERLNGANVLDFGSGSGVLSLAARALGANVLGIEIDQDAVSNAKDNVTLNPWKEGISFGERLEDVSAESMDWVVANILKSVLIPFASQVISRLKPGGSLLLSGLLETDVAEVSRAYQEQMFEHSKCEIGSKGDWRSLFWERVVATDPKTE